MFALAAGKARTGAALDNPVLRVEGRVTLIDGLLAVAVLAGLLGWAVLNRMKAQTGSWGVLSGIRALFLFAVLLACVPIAAYSACFYSVADQLPYCKQLL